jgi:hypothetical protein
LCLHKYLRMQAAVDAWIISSQQISLQDPLSFEKASIRLS